MKLLFVLSFFLVGAMCFQEMTTPVILWGRENSANYVANQMDRSGAVSATTMIGNMESFALENDFDVLVVFLVVEMRSDMFDKSPYRDALANVINSPGVSSYEHPYVVYDGSDLRSILKQSHNFEVTENPEDFLSVIDRANSDSPSMVLVDLCDDETLLSYFNIVSSTSTKKYLAMFAGNVIPSFQPIDLSNVEEDVSDDFSDKVYVNSQMVEMGTVFLVIVIVAIFGFRGIFALEPQQMYENPQSSAQKKFL